MVNSIRYRRGRIQTTTRPRLTVSSNPVTTTASHKILTNPYNQSVTYPGTHDPLVSPETFGQVQTILRQNHVIRDKP